MRRLLLFTALFASTAFAAPWGLDPGAASRDDILKKFGEPSKVLVAKDGKEVVGYFGAKAPKPAQQAQFRIDPKTSLVERIDIFLAVPITKAEVLKKYGPECPEGILPEAPCYVKKVTEDMKAYFFYPRLGLAVFFKPDGETVHTLVYTATKK